MGWMDRFGNWGGPFSGLKVAKWINMPMREAKRDIEIYMRNASDFQARSVANAFEQAIRVEHRGRKLELVELQSHFQHVWFQASFDLPIEADRVEDIAPPPSSEPYTLKETIQRAWYLLRGQEKIELDHLLAELTTLNAEADFPKRVTVAKRALTQLNPDFHQHLPHWARLQNLIARTLLDNPNSPQRKENIEEAIEHLKLAYHRLDRENNGRVWVNIVNSLALAYTHRIVGKRQENIEQSINYGKEAVARWERMKPQRLQNLAEQFSSDVHQQYREQLELMYNNMGEYYRQRVKESKADNIERAIEYYKKVLPLSAYTEPEQFSRAISSRESIYVSWPVALSNLSLAYIERIYGKRDDNLEKAITYGKLALRALPVAQDINFGGERINVLATRPTLLGNTLNNLGIAYIQYSRGNREKNLYQALAYLDEALKIRGAASQHIAWAETQNNRANVYIHPMLGGKRDANLQMAVAIWQEALAVYNKIDVPIDQAKTYLNLGRVYSDLQQDVRAVTHIQQALTVFRRDRLPSENLLAWDLLGEHYFARREWAAAFDAYQEAIATGTDLLNTAFSEVGKRAQIAKMATAYTNATYCLLQLAHWEEAVVQLDAGKTRLLTETLALNTVAEADDQVAELHLLRQQLRELSAEYRLPSNTPSRRDNLTLIELRTQYKTQLDTLIDTLRHTHSNFLPNALTLAQILAVIPLATALVAPIITSQGSAIFVIPHGVQYITAEHIIFCAEFTQDSAENLTVGTMETKGWLYTYLQMRLSPQDRDGSFHEQWLTTIETTLRQLWQQFLSPLTNKLEQSPIRHILFVPQGGLQAIPLHALWWGDAENPHYLLDDFEISYTPSAYTLHLTQQRKQQAAAPVPVVVGVNTYTKLSSLTYATREAQAVAGVFSAEAYLNQTATLSQIKAKMPSATHIHLACHGTYGWGDANDSALFFYGDEALSLSSIIDHLVLTHTELVVLSACESGIVELGELVDEFMGLTAGFIQVGAKAVISSLWLVNDLSTALFMQKFYQLYLGEKLSSRAALRKTQQWLRGITSAELAPHYRKLYRVSKDKELLKLAKYYELNPNLTPFAHPYYWAGFILTGT